MGWVGFGLGSQGPCGVWVVIVMNSAEPGMLTFTLIASASVGQLLLATARSYWWHLLITPSGHNTLTCSHTLFYKQVTFTTDMSHTSCIIRVNRAKRAGQNLTRDQPWFKYWNEQCGTGHMSRLWSHFRNEVCVSLFTKQLTNVVSLHVNRWIYFLFSLATKAFVIFLGFWYYILYFGAKWLLELNIHFLFIQVI